MCIYHGSPEERDRLRKEVLVHRTEHDSSQSSPSATPAKRKGKGRPKAPKRLGVAPPQPDLPPGTIDPFPVVLTTYEMIIRDSSYLSTHKWKYIIVDEGMFDNIREQRIGINVVEQDTVSKIWTAGLFESLCLFLLLY